MGKPSSHDGQETLILDTNPCLSRSVWNVAFCMNCPGIPCVRSRESRSPCRALWEVGESLVLLPLAFTFRLLGELVQDYWSPRTVGGCHSVYRILMLLLSKTLKVIC